MTILTVSSVSLAYGTDEILNDISFTVNEGERLGVIGANGAGKTTLFNILTGRLQPDRGNVTFARGAKAKLLSQKPEEDFGGRTGAPAGRRAQRRRGALRRAGGGIPPRGRLRIQGQNALDA